MGRGSDDGQWKLAVSLSDLKWHPGVVSCDGSASAIKDRSPESSFLRTAGPLVSQSTVSMKLGLGRGAVHVKADSMCPVELDVRAAAV